MKEVIILDNKKFLSRRIQGILQNANDPMSKEEILNKIYENDKNSIDNVLKGMVDHKKDFDNGNDVCKYKETDKPLYHEGELKPQLSKTSEGKYIIPDSYK